MNDLTPSEADRKVLQSFDEVTRTIASSVRNHWDDAYPMKPQEIPGEGILDENEQPFDPPRYQPSTFASVPDLESIQAFWDAVGNKGLALCMGHAVLGNGANLKHLLAGGAMPEPVRLAGLAFAGAALAFRDACKAQGDEFLASLPVLVQPPVVLDANPVTGLVTVSPLPE